MERPKRVAKLSHKELMTMVHEDAKLSAPVTDKSRQGPAHPEKPSNKSKRPDREIYVPGKRTPRREEDENDDTESLVDDIDQKLAEIRLSQDDASSVSSSKEIERRKRPQKEIYVPKQRRHEPKEERKSEKRDLRRPGSACSQDSVDRGTDNWKSVVPSMEFTNSGKGSRGGRRGDAPFHSGSLPRQKREPEKQQRLVRASSEADDRDSMYSHDSAARNRRREWSGDDNSDARRRHQWADSRADSGRHESKRFSERRHNDRARNEARDGLKADLVEQKRNNDKQEANSTERSRNEARKPEVVYKDTSDQRFNKPRASYSRNEEDNAEKNYPSRKGDCRGRISQPNRRHNSSDNFKGESRNNQSNARQTNRNPRNYRSERGDDNISRDGGHKVDGLPPRDQRTARGQNNSKAKNYLDSVHQPAASVASLGDVAEWDLEDELKKDSRHNSVEDWSQDVDDAENSGELYRNRGQDLAAGEPRSSGGAALYSSTNQRGDRQRRGGRQGGVEARRGANHNAEGRPQSSQARGMLRIPMQQPQQGGEFPSRAELPPRLARGRGGRGAKGGRALFDPDNPESHVHSEGLEFKEDEPHTQQPQQPYRDLSYADHYPEPRVPAHPAVRPLRPGMEYMRMPYMHHGMPPPQYGYLPSEGDHSDGPQRKAHRAKMEGLLMEISRQDHRYQLTLGADILKPEVWASVLQLRSTIQVMAKELLLGDLMFCNERNVEQILWKTLYHQLIEQLRFCASKAPDSAAEKQLLQVFDEGVDFYEKLLSEYQMTYSFHLEDFVSESKPPLEKPDRKVKMALRSVQKVMIALGDLLRYKQQMLKKSDFGAARKWYLKSRRVAPKNGRPYNQLALLALYTKRRLEAVYYYARSLAASNPIITARESLTQIFDDCRQKAEAKQHALDAQRSQRARQREVRESEGAREEVWIVNGERAADDSDDELKDVTPAQLKSRFVTNFLHVTGMLWSKTGMEKFQESASRVLHEFRALLELTPPVIDAQFLLQIAAISMFSVYNVRPAGRNRRDQAVGKMAASERLQEGVRSEHQEQAVAMALDVFALLVERARLIASGLSDDDQTDMLNPDRAMDETLEAVLPSIQCFSGWIECHLKLCNPPPLMRDPELGPQLDVFKEFADLLNALTLVKTDHVEVLKARSPSCEPFVLREDLELSGFEPVEVALSDQTLFFQPRSPSPARCEASASHSQRISRLRRFGDLLVGIEQPLLVYNSQFKSYESVAPESVSSPNTPRKPVALSRSVSEDVVVEETVEDDSDVPEKIRRLKRQKEEAMQQKRKEEEAAKAREQILQWEKGRGTRLMIRPLLLVPDTNAFIDHLDVLKKLLAAKKFTIVVPLVVVTELDGLKQGGQSASALHDEAQDNVSELAAAALAFLNAEFDKPNRRLRAMTSQGTELDSINYRTEQLDPDENCNDDRILNCCLHYCKDKARDFMQSRKADEGWLTLERNVVLLTDDRNLRVKAHARNVPVRPTRNFARLAKII